MLFTPADEPSLHCLSLRDGTLLWQANRGADDLYLGGVFGNKVLVVGKRTCRALDLADGKQLWELETGLPSGVGAAAGSIYYLPLKEAERNKGPAVYAIDVPRAPSSGAPPRQRQTRRRRRRRRRKCPGNLFLWSGEVFSQSATAVKVYSGQKDKGK